MQITVNAASGSSQAAIKSVGKFCINVVGLSLQLIRPVHVNRAEAIVKIKGDRQGHGGYCRGQHDNEQGDQLAIEANGLGSLSQIRASKRDEIQVRTVEH